MNVARIAATVVTLVVVCALMAWLAGNLKAPTSAAKLVVEDSTPVREAEEPRSAGDDPSPSERGTPVAAEASSIEPEPQLLVGVTDDLGRALPDARVEIDFEDDAGKWIASSEVLATDEAGACSFDARPSVAGAARMVVTARPGDDFVPARVTLALGTPRLTLVCPRTGRLFGNVSFEDGGIPEGDDSDLELEWRLGEDATRTVHADVVEGRYAFDGPLCGTLVSVQLQRVGMPLCRIAPLAVEIPPATSVSHDFVFERGLALEAVFRDRDTGAPIGGVHCVAHFECPESSNSEGRLFAADALERGAFVHLEFQHPDYSPWDRNLDAPTEGAALSLQVDLARSPVVQGILEDARGTPLPHVRVEAQDSVGGSAGGMTSHRFSNSTETDDAGRFRLGGLPSPANLTMTFSVRNSQGGRRVLGVDRLVLPDDAARERWTVPDPVAISGRVIDAEGQAVAGVSVSGRMRAGPAWCNATTDASGAFEISNVLPGVWVFSLSHGASIAGGPAPAARQRSLISVAVGPRGEHGVELRLAPTREGEWPTVRARLRFLDALSHEPIRDRQPLVLFEGVDNTLSLGCNVELDESGWGERELPMGRFEAVIVPVDYVNSVFAFDLTEGLEHEFVLQPKR